MVLMQRNERHLMLMLMLMLMEEWKSGRVEEGAELVLYRGSSEASELRLSDWRGWRSQGEDPAIARSKMWTLVFFNTTRISPNTNAIGILHAQLSCSASAFSFSPPRCRKRSSTTSRIDDTTHCGAAGCSSLHTGRKDHGSTTPTPQLQAVLIPSQRPTRISLQDLAPRI